MSQWIVRRDAYATLSMELQQPNAALYAQLRQTLCVKQIPNKLKCMSSLQEELTVPVKERDAFQV